MKQQVGDGEDISDKSTYGRSIDEAKSLIKQLEAFKNAPVPENSDAAAATTEGDPAISEKNAKNNVKRKTISIQSKYGINISLYRWLPMSFFIPLKLPKCIKKVNCQILMNVLRE